MVRIALATLATLAFAAFPLAAADPVALPTRLDPGALASAVDSLAARAVAAGIAPGLGVAVTLDGKVLYARSHGFADATAGIAVAEDTLWYLASTSKSVTGFATALLAEQGAFSLDAPIATLLPAARWNPAVKPANLTLGNFLSHTHHLDDSAIVMSAAFTGEVPERCWPALLAAAKPGGNQDLVYSNLGYNVAAMVIDAVRPEGWRRYLDEQVFRPAGMLETYSRVSGLDVRRIAKSHSRTVEGAFTTAPFQKTDATMNSAGGHLATLQDLARWTIVQMDQGRIDGRQIFPAGAVALGQRRLAQQTREKAKRFTDFDREGWGAGWDLGSYEGEAMVSRFGGYDSIHSHLSFLPGRRVGVVAMVNGGRGAELAGLVATLVYDLEAGKAGALARAEERLEQLRAKVSEDRQKVGERAVLVAARQKQPLSRPLSDFIGSYYTPFYGELVLTRVDGQFVYRWGALSGPVEIYDAGKDQLRIEVGGSGSIVDFRFDGHGPASAITIDDMTFERIEPGAPRSSPCPPAGPPQ